MAEDFTLISEASGERSLKTVRNLQEVKICCFIPGNFYRGKHNRETQTGTISTGNRMINWDSGIFLPGTFRDFLPGNSRDFITGMSPTFLTGILQGFSNRELSGIFYRETPGFS